MIKSKDGNVYVNGNIAILMADVSCISKYISEMFSDEYEKETLKNMLIMAVELDFKDRDEVMAETVNGILNIDVDDLGDIPESLKERFNKLKEALINGD